MSNYTTGEVAKLCGVSVRTVQYYDNRGILIPSDFSEGGRRLYSENDLKKMKVICYLRELNFSIDNIAKLLNEKNSDKVIALIIQEQRFQLEHEVFQKQQMIEKLKELEQAVTDNVNFSLNSITDLAHIMENKKKIKKLHLNLLLMGLPMILLELAAIALWIFTGIWWPVVVYAVLAIPFAIFISKYYFNRVSYICPNCKNVFTPSFKEAFFAMHTPNTRKLTCPQCKQKSYCVETYRNPSNEK